MILELWPSFLNTLSVGEHQISVISDDGETLVAVKVLEASATDADDTPATGDTWGTVLWWIFIILSAAGFS